MSKMNDITSPAKFFAFVIIVGLLILAGTVSAGFANLFDTAVVLGIPTILTLMILRNYFKINTLETYISKLSEELLVIQKNTL